MVNRESVERALRDLAFEHDVEVGDTGLPVEFLLNKLSHMVKAHPGDSKANRQAECVLAAAGRGEKA